MKRQERKCEGNRKKEKVDRRNKVQVKGGKNAQKMQYKRKKIRSKEESAVQKKEKAVKEEQIEIRRKVWNQKKDK